MGWFDDLFGDDGGRGTNQGTARPSRDPFGRLIAEPVFDAFRRAWKAGAKLFDLFGDDPVSIKQAVGPNAPNRRDDVAKVETFLDRTGHLDLAKTEGPTGYYGTRVDQGIKNFQKDNALKVDGLINPAGPTLSRIGALLSEIAGDVADQPWRTPGFNTDADRPSNAREPAEGTRPSTSSPSLLDRGAGWFHRPSAGHTAEARKPAAPKPRSSAPVRRTTGDDHIGAWFEGGPIPDGVTHDDPMGAEKFMRNRIERWRRDGLTDAAENLLRYLDGKSGIVPLSRDEARKFEHVRNGEEENKDRFVNATFLAKDTNDQSALRLREMKDGDEIEFGDKWDAIYRIQDAAMNYLLGDANFALAYGANKLASQGKFTAKRQGDRIAIEGVVRQTWNEPYDFERGQPGAVEGHTLERHGKATPYRSVAEWEQPVRAVVRIRNGKLHDVESVNWGAIRDLRKAPPK